MQSLSREDIQQVITVIQDLYEADSIPWVCGYSGGKDSTAVVQLVWSALDGLPKDKLTKDVHIISTDTLVESPVVAAWVEESLEKMRMAAAKSGLPIHVHRLTPSIENTYWVNLIGRGYPYPRRNMRWCTDRLKINPSNAFIENMISKAGEAILVLGTRKAESATRRRTMEDYEKKRVREHLSPNGSMMNSYVFSPIESWSNENVWQYLMQYRNTWGQSNKALLSMYSGASADSRFGCWVCTMVSEDKSMAAMIQNDEEKAWMLPLLEFRNDIAADNDTDRDRRDFRRMDGRLTYHRNRLVHGPYTKKTREYFLRRLLQVEKIVKENGPAAIHDHPLITMDELKRIRQIWLEEKHEFDDSLPRIYEEETGLKFEDARVHANKYFGHSEWELLSETCKALYPDETLMLGLQSALVDIESQYAMQATRRGIKKELNAVLQRNCYRDEDDATAFYEEHNDIAQNDEQGGESDT